MNDQVAEPIDVKELFELLAKWIDTEAGLNRVGRVITNNLDCDKLRSHNLILFIMFFNLNYPL